MLDDFAAPDRVKFRALAKERHDDIVSAVIAIALRVVQRLVNIADKVNDELRSLRASLRVA